MLMILAVFSIFFGFITKDMFIGLGSGFFSDNALFIHPSHEIMLDTEFGVPTLFKLLPLIFTISLSVIAIVLSEYLSTILIYFKLSRVGYNIFSFFNQRFLIELFYNRYITGIILKLGGQTTKVIDKGSVEYLGPYGLEKGLLNISNNISRLNTGVITSYALYILIGLIAYLLFNSYINSTIIIVVLVISLSLVLHRYDDVNIKTSSFMFKSVLAIPGVMINLEPVTINMEAAIHYSVSTLIYLFDCNIVTCDAPNGWGSYFPQDNTSYYPTVFALLIWAILLPLAIQVLHFNKDNLKKGGRRILTILWYCLTIQNIILLLYTLYIIVNLFFVLDHILSSDISSYFSDQYAHAGVDSAYIANNQPDDVLFSTNPDGTNGSSGSSGNSGSGTTDGYHHHPSCFCPHENTVDMPASESPNNKCCLCGGDHPDSACVNCDCQVHDRCLADTDYNSVLPNNGNNGNNN